MDMAEQFSTKMLILRQTKTAPTGYLYEFTLDDESHTLDDVVSDSLRTKFNLDSDGVRYSMQSKEGDILLLKLMKGLKQSGWSVHASTSHTGASTVESVFYYEKSITAARSSSNVARSPVSTGSSTKSGVEESKSATVYASKPLPSAPVRASADEADDSRRNSASITTNRDKLLQKYNQHRRSSATRGLQGEDGAEPTRLSVSQLSKSFAGSATTPPAPPVPVSKVAASPLTPVTPAAPATSAVAPAVPAPQPAAASPATALETPKLGAASAYPSLVKRISSKGFLAGAAAATNVDATSSSKVASSESLSSRSDGVAQSTVTESAVPAATKPAPPAAPLSAPARPPSMPPPAAAPPVPPPAAVPPALMSAAASITAPAPAPAPVTPTLPSPPTEQPPVTSSSTAVEPPATPQPPVAAPPAPATPATSSAPVQSEPAEESHDEIVRSSANPLTSTFPVQRRSAGTADNDPHEANRTNHYSKLGSAFLTGNGLLGGRGRGGAGRGFGSQQNLFAPMK